MNNDRLLRHLQENEDRMASYKTFVRVGDKDGLELDVEIMAVAGNGYLVDGMHAGSPETAVIIMNVLLEMKRRQKLKGDWTEDRRREFAGETVDSLANDVLSRRAAREADIDSKSGQCGEECSCLA